MKKRFIYICMFASLLTFSSCNEALDVLALTICPKRVYDIISGATIP